MNGQETEKGLKQFLLEGHKREDWPPLKAWVKQLWREAEEYKDFAEQHT